MSNIVQITAADVRAGLASGEVLLIDVREANEFAFERIPGALLYPLSTFDPKAVPIVGGKKLVMQCAAGGRSMRAAQALVAAGHAQVYNLEGGINAWKAQGLPLILVEPTTGQVVEHGRI
ncbi:MAG TPA: rhodanese-like domain-containing protein [Steroidobacteraceae bacterium]